MFENKKQTKTSLFKKEEQIYQFESNDVQREHFMFTIRPFVPAKDGGFFQKVLTINFHQSQLTKILLTTLLPTKMAVL